MSDNYSWRKRYQRGYGEESASPLLKEYLYSMSNLINALKMKLEGEVAVAKANIEVYMTSSVGIGEHPDLVAAIESQFDVIANARDKLDAIDEFEKDE